MIGLCIYIYLGYGYESERGGRGVDLIQRTGVG